MLKSVIFIVAIILISGVQSAHGQFQIRLPKIPKIEKPKNPPDSSQPEPKMDTQPPRSEPEGRSASNYAASQEQPTVVKDTVHATAYTQGSYRGDFDVWSWTPRIEFRVNGSIPSGGQLYAEFTLPAGPAIKFDCRTEETQQGYVWSTSCGGPRVPEEQSSLYTGPISFAIRMRNELAGTDATLFTGKMKIEKASSSLVGPKAAKKFVYFVNHDWNLPIGYVYLTPSDVFGMKAPGLDFAFWIRGDYQGNFEPHLFYQGKEVGKKYLDGREVGKPGCDPEATIEPSQTVANTMPQKASWVRVRCNFFGILGWDKSGNAPGLFGPPYQLSANPGEYEIKVLRANRLARSMKFTAGPDGKFDNGIAAANRLGRDRVIVPVQIIGDQDGQWDRTAWKTEAFYGNPLQGFVAQ